VVGGGARSEGEVGVHASEDCGRRVSAGAGGW
jgi:hypothetical protein